MRTFLRRLGIGLGVVVLLAVVAAAGLHLAGGRKLARTYAVTPRPPAEPVADSALLARGQHVATALAKCAACHGDDLGGRVFIDDPALGRLSASNLTPGGPTAAYTLADWDRAVRHGVRPDGRGLLVMPSDEFVHLSDHDFAAVVAYLRQLPPVTRELPPTTLRFVGRALLATNQLPMIPAARIDHAAPTSPPAPGVTREYGRYLAVVGGCTGCHGATLAGGPYGEPGAPPAANLTPTGIGSWTEADFRRALRDGVRPNGSPISDKMPWKYTRLMTDDEIAALYMYVRSVPPRALGEREEAGSQ